MLSLINAENIRLLCKDNRNKSSKPGNSQESLKFSNDYLGKWTTKNFYSAMMVAERAI